jgi:hypothetical protein
MIPTSLEDPTPRGSQSPQKKGGILKKPNKIDISKLKPFDSLNESSSILPLQLKRPAVFQQAIENEINQSTEENE